MDKNYDSLDEWRIYFKSANVDIFVVIEHAIMVAAVDFPNELREKRCSITEMMFTCRVTRCFVCNSVDLAVPHVYVAELEAKYCRPNNNVVNEELGTRKSNDIIDGKKTEEGDNGNERFEMELNNAANQTSNSGLEHADEEVLSDGIDEEFRTIGEVMRIKNILDNHGEQSEAVVIDSLRKLQLMTLSVDTLKITDIGKSVSALKKQESKQIKQLVRALIGDWKAKVDEWMEAIEAVAGTECTSESAKAPVEEEEEWFPFPPMDEGAFLTTSTMDLSKLELLDFFDDLDENGNFRISGEFNEDGRKASRENQKWSNAAPQEAVVKKPTMAASQNRHTEKPKEQEAVHVMKKPILAAPQKRDTTEQPKAQEAEVKKPIMAAPQDKHTEKPKELEAVVKKPIMAAPQGRPSEKPEEKEARMKKPIMAAPQGSRHTEQPKEQEARMKKPIVAAPQDRYTEKPEEREAVMKAPLMVAPQDVYTEQPKQPVAVTKMAAPQDRHTKQPKEQETLAKKLSNTAAQHRCTQQPNEQEAVFKKPSNAAHQDWYTPRPKEQAAVLKKPSNAVPQDWYTSQPKDQETVLKKPSNAAAQDWFTPPPKEEEAAVKNPTFFKPNKLSSNGSGPQRLARPTVEHKVNGNARVKFQLKSNKRHAVSQQNKLNCPDEMTLQERVAVAKRKLEERNQAMEDAKKRRISQSLETHSIPKQSLDPRNTQVYPGNNSKQGTNGGW